MRYLYTADDVLFAYAPGRRDFFLAGDDQLWAHESHGWLIAAKSGVALAHRTGDVYYGAVNGERLYRLAADLEPADLEPESGGTEAGTESPLRARRAPQRAARARH
jgi:hypothetical protein